MEIVARQLRQKLEVSYKDTRRLKDQLRRKDEELLEISSAYDQQLHQRHLLDEDVKRMAAKLQSDAQAQEPQYPNSQSRRYVRSRLDLK